YSGHYLPHRYGTCSYYVLKRAALKSVDYQLVHVLGVRLQTENQAAARTAQRLVRRGGDDLRVRHRRRVNARRHETGEVRNIDHEDGPDLVGDAPEGGEVDHPGVGAAAPDQDPGPLAPGDLAHLIVVDAPGVLAHAVGGGPKQHTGEVDGRAVRQVATVRQRQPEQRIPQLRHREVGRHVGLRTRMRLHVHMLGFEQRFGAIDRELLHLVHDFTAAVVPLLGEPLGVLVGERRAHGLHDGHGGEVL